MSTETQDDPIAAPLPRIFGRYLLIHRLSRGGMGEIFLARYGLAGFEKLAVIKKVLPHLAADEEFIARFVTEAQVAVKLQHANIAQVFEVGRVGDEYFLALEHIHGRDLRRTLSLVGASGRGMPPDLCLFIAREVANALAYAHRRTDEDGRQLGLVHCDISPPNVMMSFDGEVKIIDFGIAKSALMAMDKGSKRGFGKFGYMAPEQLIRGREVEARTDIYALGSVLFEMLTGTRLYELGESPDYKALARMAAKGQHPVPSDHDPSLAPYDELVRRALQPNVDDRFATAADFRDAIQRNLVELNPTISVDELAAFMRFMFAEDVLRQQNEIERLDKTQISQWESELTREAQETISFALGGVLEPARQDPESGAPAEAADSSSAASVAVSAEKPGTAETPATATEAEPVSRDRTAIVGLADDEPAARPRVLLWVAAAALLFGAGGALAWSLGQSSEARDSAAATAGLATSPATPPIAALEPAPIEPAPAAGLADDDPPEPPKLPVPERKPRTLEKSNRVASERQSGSSNDATRDVTRGDEPIVEDAIRKFKAANREYQRFRKKHGGQLHAEWTELLKYATFAKNDSSKAAALVKKINGFRKKMRQINRETL